MISIQSVAVQRGSVYTLPMNYFILSGMGLGGSGIMDPVSGASHSCLLLGDSTWGKVPCQGLSLHSCEWTVLQETPGVLPCTEQQPAPGPGTLELAVPGPCSCSCPDTPVQVQPLGCHCHFSCTQTDPKGLTFTLNDLAPASNNRPGGFCWLIRCKASH